MHDRFEGENGVRLTLNQRAQLTSNIAGLWLGLRLQLIGVVTVTSVAFIAVFEHHFGSVNPGVCTRQLRMTINAHFI